MGTRADDRTAPPGVPVRGRRPGDRPTAGVLGLAAAVAALVVLLQTLAATAWSMDLTTGGLAAVALVALGVLLAELMPLHVELERQTYSFSLSEVPLLLGLLICSPLELALAHAGGGLLALAWRRPGAVKSVVNTCLFALQASIAAVVFGLLVGRVVELSPDVWLAGYVAMTAAGATGSAVVLGAIALSAGRVERRDLTRILAPSTLTAIFSTTMGLLAALVLRAEPRAAVLLAVASLLLAIGYRTYAVLVRRHSDLGLVGDFTRTLGAAGDVAAMHRVLLERARAALLAKRAWLVLRDESGTVHLELTDDGFEEAPAGQAEHFMAALGRRRSAVLARGSRDRDVRAWLERRGANEAVVAALDGPYGPGMLGVADRITSTGRYGNDDRRLLETLSVQAGLALANGSLVDRLHYDAHHDALTGLANRPAFVAAVDEHLTAGAALAVLVLDVDRFKEVNDTLGHVHGDVLLQEIGRRLTALPACRSVARLAGDEFAVLALLPGDLDPAAQPSAARTVAAEIRRDLARLLVVDGVPVSAQASVGLALAPAHGGDAATLLRRAEAAMYAGKSSGRGVHVYTPEVDEGGTERLALAAELREALDQGQLQLYYQPKVALGQDRPDDRVVGVEALVRWAHPERGMVPPIVFVPLAESTGLIDDLTSWVLSEAIGQVGRWAADGLSLSVAVNLSARNLLDPSLPARVERLLADAGVPASSLVLEVTESCLMAEPERTVPVLESLATLGVSVSVDDFGTGYSSLGYLHRLPVNEVKVDRSFVRDVLDPEAPGGPIVRAVVDLAHALGLRVVAEGAEDLDTVAVLDALGCDLVQGYVYSPPMPPQRLVAWVRDRTRAVPRPRDGDRAVTALLAAR